MADMADIATMAGNFFRSIWEDVQRKIKIEKEVPPTVRALYEANVSDSEILQILNKIWDIPASEAQHFLKHEKVEAPIRELQYYLETQIGYSTEQIQNFISQNHVWNKIRANPKLWSLRRTPEKLFALVQDDKKLEQL